MASISPPTKPPELKKYGGGGNDPYIRDIDDEEKQLVLGGWIGYSRRIAMEEEDPRLEEFMQVCRKMQAWRRGTGGARKRRFALAACQGDNVDAVVCVQIGPDNRSFAAFITQDMVMTVGFIAVSPSRAKLGAGTFLVKQLKEIGRAQGIRVDFEPLKEVYKGRFYLASISM
ncbi:hypothetical protein JKP88DRAFT_329089 [Tribonema minus]|uniref:N-acetyltransferase domain-containing protein n=1 Tax=Tribonema minus TaxID=303371 RepID=A0A835YR80_9STRA|nr:hypothetical protein JKP88DRAFT_329089 [Tribonema minus]